ncbi:ABC transporter substrate-binding protein [Pokkaliibacter sp. CJK22405]|uniref:ABC transporter substrate-binding protein n=1 Tax=Pokkaliibacter sp. CJK22405 TaxID=3384615 RepID=UPI0039851168
MKAAPSIPSFKTLALGLTTLGMAIGFQTAQADTWCEQGNTVKFAGINWESGELLTDLMRTVLEKGYSCKTDAIPGNSITMEQALGQNDIQVFAEEWIGRSEAWNKAAKAGTVIGVGAPIKNATEGWYVPRYLVEGDKERGIEAKAPDLKAIADLDKYAMLFKDPEEQSKGRFYNCPAGWTCELENSEKLEEYGLDKTYVNFRPGTGAALDAAISSSYKRGKPFVTYYWSPTAMLGKYDLVQLKEKPEDEKEIKIQVGISKVFQDEAPQLVDVLSKVNVPIDLLNKSLAKMSDEKLESDEVARLFLKEHPEVWHQWVSEEAARKIDASVAGQ